MQTQEQISLDEQRTIADQHATQFLSNMIRKLNQIKNMADVYCDKIIDRAV